MQFFFAGGENATYRRMLLARGVEKIAVNFAYTKGNLPRLLSEEEWPGIVVYCSKPAKGYLEWVKDHISLLDFALVSEWTEEWAELPLAVPLWDGKDPVMFPGMCQATPSGWVAVSALAARNHESVIRQARFDGRKLFGLGISSIALWDRFRFDAVAALDWSLAYQRHEAQMLDGAGHIRRFRDERLPLLVEEFGVAAQRLLEGTGKTLRDAVAGDRDALATLSVAAWKGAETWWTNGQRSGLRLVVDNSPVPTARPHTDDARGFVDGLGEAGVIAPVIHRTERKVIPVVSESSRAGMLSTVDALQLGCDRCVLQRTCDEYNPGHSCAYEIPVSVRTKAEMVHLLQSIIELQTRRVLFASMVEQSMGGAPDPVTSGEIDRLGTLIKNAADVQSDRFRFTVEASGPGVLSRLFGGQVGEAAQQLPIPVMASQVMSDVVDTELLTDDD